MEEFPGYDQQINQIFSAIRVRLAAVVQYRIRDEKAREDVVQEAMLVLVEKYPSLPSKETAWLFAMRVLHHKVGDYYRRWQRQEGRLVGLDHAEAEGVSDARAGAPRPDEILERSEVEDRVRRAIDELGPECRRLVLGLLDGQSRPALAAELNKTIDALYKQLSRCTAQLRALLGGRR